MFRIRKKFRFEAAHRLRKAYSKECMETIHGHSYICELFFKAEELKNDMVLDFGELKEVIEEITTKFDHSLILPTTSDEEYLDATNKKIIHIINPTAERMCVYIYNTVKIKFPQLYKVRLHETCNGWAEFEEGEYERNAYEKHNKGKI